MATALSPVGPARGQEAGPALSLRPSLRGETCSGPNLETKDCFLKTCPPVDGGWTSWTRWSACSTSCDWGEQRRTRTCTQPPAQFGGRECTGARFQNNKCMLRRCPTTEDTEISEANVTATLSPEVAPYPFERMLSASKTVRNLQMCWDF